MAYTAIRVQPWTEIMGADGEKILAIGGRVAFFSSISGVAGVNIMPGATVPAGQIWVITAIFIRNATHACTDMYAQVIGATTPIVSFVQAPAVGVPLSVHCFIPMLGTENLDAIFDGVTLNDTLQFSYIGYSMLAP